MIDVENEVYTRVASALRKAVPDVNITGSYVREPASFPHVCIEQSDSYTPADRETTSAEEPAQIVTFEVNFYSNKPGGKKQECKALAAVADDVFRAMNFRRLALVPTPNLIDATIYRLSGRYRGETDGANFYRR